MASIHKDPKSSFYRIMFRYGGKQFQKSLDTKDEKTAEGMKGKIELILRELEHGRKHLPTGADLWEFLKTDGQRLEKVKAPTVVTLTDLFERYLTEMPAGTMEASGSPLMT